MQRKKIGTISVDAGLCWLGDPCYIIHNEDGLPSSLGENWDEFCDKLHNHFTNFYHAGQVPGLGVVVSTGDGDGVYPVYATFDDRDRIRKVEVIFD